MAQIKVVFLLVWLVVACSQTNQPVKPEVLYYDASQELATALHEVFAARWPIDSIVFKNGTPQYFLQNPQIRQLWFVDLPKINLPEKDAHGFSFTHVEYATDAWIFVSKQKKTIVNWADDGVMLLAQTTQLFLLNQAASTYFSAAQNVSVVVDEKEWLSILHNDTTAIGVCLRSQFLTNKQLHDFNILPINYKDEHIFATAETIGNATYPMLATMHVLQRVQKHDASVLFLDFALSPPGRLLCTKQGWQPQQLAERKLRFY